MYLRDFRILASSHESRARVSALAPGADTSSLRNPSLALSVTKNHRELDRRRTRHREPIVAFRGGILVIIAIGYG